MLRRMATLWVLLLGLSGMLPAALACVAGMDHADCCPRNQPCESRGDSRGGSGGRTVALDGGPCCVVQAPASPSSQATLSRAELRFDDVPVPDQLLALVPNVPTVSASAGAPTVIDFVPPRLLLDQQQIYLLTARLRL